MKNSSQTVKTEVPAKHKSSFRKIVGLAISRQLTLVIGTALLVVAWLLQNFCIEPNRDTIANEQKYLADFQQLQSAVNDDLNWELD